MTKQIIIGSDHAAFPLKEELKKYLQENGYDVTDVGTFSEESVHYPQIAAQVAHAVSEGTFERGLLLCGTGLGVSMVANRFPHVRCGLCNELFSAIMSRRHNNANILAMGGRVIGITLAQEILTAWLETPFEGGRHAMRIEMFDEMGDGHNAQEDPMGTCSL